MAPAREKTPEREKGTVTSFCLPGFTLAIQVLCLAGCSGVPHRATELLHVVAVAARRPLALI